MLKSTYVPNNIVKHSVTGQALGVDLFRKSPLYRWQIGGGKINKNKK